MNTERKIFTNTALLSTAEFVGQLANFGFVVLFARRFGPDVLGWYTLAMAIGATGSVLISAGLNALFIREIARDRTRTSALVGVAFPAQCGSALVVWLAIAGIATFVGTDTEAKLVLLVVGAYHVLVRCSALLMLPFAARESMLPSSVASAGRRLAILCVAAAAMGLGMGAPGVLLAMPFSAAIFFLWAYYLARSRRYVAWRWDALELLAYLKRALPFFATSLIAVLYVRSGYFLLAGMEGPAATGIYAAGDRILVAAWIVQTMFVAAVYPAMSRLGATSPARLIELTGRCVRLQLFFMVPLAAMLMIFRADVIRLVLGDEFAAAQAVILLLAPAFVVAGINALLSTAALARSLQKQMFWCSAISFLLFLTMAVPLIVHRGAIGLGAAVAIREALMLIAVGGVLLRQGLLPPLASALGRPMLAVAAGMAVAWMTLDQPVVFRALLALVAISMAVFAVGAVRSHDIRFLRRIFDPSRGP